MPFIGTREQRAGLLILVLGGILAYTLWPYMSGLLGAPVLYVIFGSLHRRLTGVIGKAPAALVILLLALVLIAVPIVAAGGMVANEATGWAQAVVDSEILAKLKELEIGSIKVGEQIQDFSKNFVSIAGNSAIGLVGTGARLLIQLTISFFGFYYLLMDPAQGRRMLESFIPFAPENRARLLDAFRNVTVSMLIGTMSIAIVQGALLALTFQILGFRSPVFWGIVTMILAILPLVGSGLVWGPGAVFLFMQGRTGAAILLVLIGVIIIGNVDTLIRPFVFAKYAKMHPFITIIGAFAFVPKMGILGLVVGPLAVSYFFEVVRMYRDEYMDATPVPASPSPVYTATPSP